MIRTRWIQQESQSDNAAAALLNLLLLLKLPVTKDSARETVSAHPDYPALSALSDSLAEWGVESMPVKLSRKHLQELEFPCLAHFHKHGGHFVILKELQDDVIRYIDPESGHCSLPLSDFEKQWSGAVLLVNAENAKGETGYRIKRRKEIAAGLRLPAALILLSALIVVTLVCQDHSLNAFFLSILSLKAAGLILSVLLLLHYFSHNKTFLRRTCPSGKTMNCQSVLFTPAAKIFGIPMADLGALYFSGGMLSLLFASVQNNVAGTWLILAALNLLTLPYSLFSIVYQAFVTRQWCWMCVCIQCIFWAECLLFVNQNTLMDVTLSLQGLLPALWGFLLPLSVWLLIRHPLSEAAKTPLLYTALMRLKNNPAVLRASLSAQPPVKADADLPFELSSGAASPSLSVIMVSHPRCGVCALTHRFLADLAAQFPETFAYTVRFHCPHQDVGRRMAERILALAHQGEMAAALDALEKAYHTREKDLASWEKSYPVSSLHAVLASATLEKHVRWANSLNVRSTPVFIVNGRLLPAEFSIYDIKALVKQCSEKAQGAVYENA